MTRLELRTLVYDYVDDPNGSYFTESVVNLRLNLAQRELQKHLISANKQYYAHCVYTYTANGQKNYGLPTDFLQIIRLDKVVQGSGSTAVTQQIYPVTPNQQNILIDVSGDPTNYFFEKNELIFLPTPVRTQQINLTYSYMIADMTSDSDQPDAPNQFQEYIAVLCARDCFIKDGRSLEPINNKMMEYKELLKQQANQRNADYPRMVRSTEDGFGIW